MIENLTNDDIYEWNYRNNDVGGTYKTCQKPGWLVEKHTSPTSFFQEGKKITDPQAMADLQMKTFSDKTKQNNQRASTSYCRSL